MSGLLVGFLLGYFLKRSRFCFTSGFRDVYLEKKFRGILVFLVIIFIQSLIFFSLLYFKIVPIPKYENFSIPATIIGSLIFGIGAIYAQGCITTSLIKVGDGRFSGVVSILAFGIIATTSKIGLFSPVVDKLQKNYGIVNDDFALNMSNNIFLIVIPILIVLLFFLFKDIKDYPKKKSLLTPKYKGLRHIFFELIWDTRFVCILIGLISGVSYFFNFLFNGETKGWGLTTPIIGVTNTLIKNQTEISWGTFFVVGIVLGSFFCAYGSGEFSLTGSDGKTLFNSLIGGIFMGIGSVLAKGCIIGNGLTGTAMFSIRSWLSIIFIIIGIWIATYIKIVRPYKNT